MTAHINDSKFDQIRGLTADELASIYLGWSKTAPKELVVEYYAAIDAANKEALIEIFRSTTGPYNDKDRNHYL